jgi:hypothetical protein
MRFGSVTMQCLCLLGDDAIWLGDDAILSFMKPNSTIFLFLSLLLGLPNTSPAAAAAATVITLISTGKSAFLCLIHMQ